MAGLSNSKRPEESGAGDEQEEIRVGWRMGGLGMEVAALVMAGLLLGWLWDRWQGTTIGIKIGAVAGIVVGLWSLIQGSLKLGRQLDARHPTKGRGKPLPERDDPGTETAHADDDWNNDQSDDHQADSR
jgi:F0F1-type ATP synthase assembly protein I